MHNPRPRVLIEDDRSIGRNLRQRPERFVRSIVDPKRRYEIEGTYDPGSFDEDLRDYPDLFDSNGWPKFGDYDRYSLTHPITGCSWHLAPREPAVDEADPGYVFWYELATAYQSATLAVTRELKDGMDVAPLLKPVIAGAVHKPLARVAAVGNTHYLRSYVLPELEDLISRRVASPQLAFLWGEFASKSETDRHRRGEGSRRTNSRDAQEVSWAAISGEFDLICIMASDLQLPSEDEIDAYKVSLAWPKLVKSNLAQQIQAGTKQAQPNRGEGNEPLERAIRILQSSFSEPPPAAHLAPYFRDPVEVVKEAIERKKLSLDFVWAWGKLQEAAGELRSLMTPDSNASSEFLNRFRQATKTDTTLQRYWYAYWLDKGGAFEEEGNRRDLNEELADLCLSIWEGQQEPVSFAREWFKTMITIGDKDDFGTKCDLRRTYRDLSLPTLKRMVRNHLIPISILPPLSPESFPQMRQR